MSIYLSDNQDQQGHSASCPAASVRAEPENSPTGIATISIRPILSPYHYVAIAERFVGSRWHEAEHAILRNAECSVRYAKNVVKGRWPEAEVLISSYQKQAIEYWDLCGQQFDVNAAALCPYWAYRYARDVVKGKLPPKLHHKMQMWAMSREYRSNKYIQLYINSKKYR